MRSIRRIVHPTDFSPASRKALVWAIRLAKQNRAELVVVHVLPPPVPIFEAESAERPQAEAHLASVVKKLRWVRIKTRRVLLKGKTSVATHIIDCARIFRADLFVMGTRGSTGIARLFKGSVASMVIASAHCPVLVVRARSLPGVRVGAAKARRSL
jgi:nucleotide-binding universal stress UspA family protein